MGAQEKSSNSSNPMQVSFVDFQLEKSLLLLYIT